MLLQERVKLLAYVWAIVRDEHLCEDIFQEVSLLAVDKRDLIHDKHALIPWLRKTARHRALHAIESRKRRPVLLSETLLDTLDECWQRYDDKPAATLADILRKCVAQLTPHARRIIALRYVQGLSGIQIAEMLGRKVRTIYMALSRTHGNLRRCVQQGLADEEGPHG